MLYLFGAPQRSWVTQKVVAYDTRRLVWVAIPAYCWECLHHISSSSECPFQRIRKYLCGGLSRLGTSFPPTILTPSEMGTLSACISIFGLCGKTPGLRSVGFQQIVVNDLEDPTVYNVVH